jgi:hypothetical protein
MFMEAGLLSVQAHLWDNHYISLTKFKWLMSGQTMAYIARTVRKTQTHCVGRNETLHFAAVTWRMMMMQGSVVSVTALGTKTSVAIPALVCVLTANWYTTTAYCQHAYSTAESSNMLTRACFAHPVSIAILSQPVIQGPVLKHSLFIICFLAVF